MRITLCCTTGLSLEGIPGGNARQRGPAAETSTRRDWQRTSDCQRYAPLEKRVTYPRCGKNVAALRRQEPLHRAGRTVPSARSDWSGAGYFSTDFGPCLRGDLGTGLALSWECRCGFGFGGWLPLAMSEAPVRRRKKEHIGIDLLDLFVSGIYADRAFVTSSLWKNLFSQRNTAFFAACCGRSGRRLDSPKWTLPAG